MNDSQRFWRWFAAAFTLVVFGSSLLIRFAHAHQDEGGYVAPREAVPPYSLTPADLRPVWADEPARFAIQQRLLVVRARLASLLTDRFLAPYDAWASEADPSLRVAFPMDEKQARWYLLRVRGENVHNGKPIYLRFRLDPAARAYWDCGNPGCPYADGCAWHRNADGTLTYQTMPAYARAYRDDVAAALERYLAALLDDADAAEYRYTLVTGRAQLFWLASADADVERVPKEQEIR